MTTKILINHIKRATCVVYGITTVDLDRQDRRKRYVAPRQMAIAAARALTEQSGVKIGQTFGRDEQTVRHATKAVSDLIVSDPRELETYDEICRLARRYAEGDFAATPAFSRSADLDFVPDREIRAMSDDKVPAWTIAQRLGVPVTEVSRVLEGV